MRCSWSFTCKLLYYAKCEYRNYSPYICEHMVFNGYKMMVKRLNGTKITLIFWILCFIAWEDIYLISARHSCKTWFLDLYFY